MRILVSTSTLPVTLDDGMPRFVYDLAEALARGAEVVVLAPGVPGAPAVSRLGMLDVHRFTYFWPSQWARLTGSKGRGMIESFRDSWLAKLQTPGFFVMQYLATRRLVRRLKIDVVNAHWIIPQGLTAACALGKSRRAKLVLHVHGGDVCQLARLWFGKAVARFVVKRCDAIFAAGSQVRDRLDALLGFPSGATLQPMGVHCEKFGSAAAVPAIDERAGQNGEYLLFFGRLVEIKGAVYLIRAMPGVLREFPDVRLLIIGSGPCEDEIRAEIARLSLGPSVRMLGRKSHREIAGYLRGCRAAIVPSIIDSRGDTEGMPTVVLEAMAAGVAVVASRVDGIPDVVRDGENGWLCRPQDPDDLAERIIAVLRGEGGPELVDAARQTAKRHDWQQVAANYLRRIEALEGFKPGDNA